MRSVEILIFYIYSCMSLSKSVFSNVITNAPLIAIDLCLVKGKKLLLGKRINPPAKDFFFVPGGRILKSERIKNAFERVLKSELGLNLKKSQNKSVKTLGIYEHFYDNNFLDNKEFNTHYIVIAYLIPYEALTKVVSKIKNPQHSEYIWFDINNKNNYSLKIHEYVLEYLKNPLFNNLST